MKSPTQIAIFKFKKNLPAVLGLAYFCVWLAVSIFAYFISPDDTQNANNQRLELGKKPPNTHVFALTLPLSQTNMQESQQKVGFFTLLWKGKPQISSDILLKNADISIQKNKIYFTTLSGAKESIAVEKFGFSGSNLSEFRNKFLKERVFRLGTDSYGRDLLSRLLLGSRVSIAVGLLSALLSVFIGIIIGCVAGYFGGKTDNLLMWFISVVWSLPTLLLAIVLGFVMGTGFWQLMLAIALSTWVEVARMVRGQVLGIRNLQYIEATKSLAYPAWRVMFRHILPNIFSPIIVLAVANFGSAVLIESGMSFLGLGVELGVPTWGRMIFEGYTFIVFENGKWLAIFPGLALISLIISINLIGNGLRDSLL